MGKRRVQRTLKPSWPEFSSQFVWKVMWDLVVFGIKRGLKHWETWSDREIGSITMWIAVTKEWSAGLVPAGFRPGFFQTPQTERLGQGLTTSKLSTPVLSSLKLGPGP